MASQELLEQLLQAMSDLKNGQRDLESNLSERIDNGQSELRNDLGTVRSDLGTVRSDLGAVRSDLDNVQTNLGTRIENVQSSLKEDLKAVQQNLDSKMTKFKQDVESSMTNFRTEVSDKIGQIDISMGRIKKSQKSLTTDVSNLKELVSVGLGEDHTEREQLRSDVKNDVDLLNTQYGVVNNKVTNVGTKLSTFPDQLEQLKEAQETSIGLRRQDVHDQRKVISERSTVVLEHDGNDRVVRKYYVKEVNFVSHEYHRLDNRMFNQLFSNNSSESVCSSHSNNYRLVTLFYRNGMWKDCSWKTNMLSVRRRRDVYKSEAMLKRGKGNQFEVEARKPRAYQKQLSAWWIDLA